MSGTAIKTLSPPERVHIVLALENALAVARSLPVSQNCDQCLQFDKLKNWCNTFKANIPDSYLSDNDCPSWEEDIPF